MTRKALVRYAHLAAGRRVLGERQVMADSGLSDDNPATVCLGGVFTGWRMSLVGRLPALADGGGSGLKSSLLIVG